MSTDRVVKFQKTGKNVVTINSEHGPDGSNHQRQQLEGHRCVRKATKIWLQIYTVNNSTHDSLNSPNGVVNYIKFTAPNMNAEWPHKCDTDLSQQAVTYLKVTKTTFTEK